MNRQSLLAQLADIERQLQDPTLSNMDRDRLDQIWEDTYDRLDELTIELPPIDDTVWRGASEFLAEYEGRTPTPPPASPIRMAPSPPPVARSFSSPGWPPPPLSSTHIQGLRPSEIVIPEGFAETAAPPPPRPWEPSEEDIERANAAEDDREGCARCAGCAYCRGEDGFYDGADEV